MVNERLDLIYTLEQNHHVKTIADLLKIKADLEGKLQQISSFDEELMELEKEKTILLKKLQDKALALSVKRKEIVPKIEKNICENLSQLGMPEVQFKVHITETQDLMITGLNQIEFLFASNQHITPQPMSKIASGGEVSRVMLCVKSLISNQKDIPTIIFDEIDTGVSGDIADKMGDIMQDMGQQMQVISITHLPQIAAKGKAQYKVFKTDKGKFLGTQIKKLNIEDRVIEIAQMLSGATLSDAAIKNAEVLLKQHLE
jgi:DNA repair protein RecN (Recombination protein N)